MRTLWEAVSVVATVNVAVVIGLVVWLWSSDHLDAERMRAVKTILTVPNLDGIWPPAPRQATSTAWESVESAPSRPSSYATLIAQSGRADRERRTQRRFEEEHALLLEQLAFESARIADERARLDAERDAWTAQVEAETARRNDEQFRRSVRLLDGLPPKQAKQHLAALIETDDLDLAAAYLDAMQVRKAQKTLAEFRTPGEVEQARALLERMRTPLALGR